MAEIKFKLNMSGLSAVMRSPEMQAVLTDGAEQIAAAANAAASPNIKNAAGGYVAKPARPIRFIALADVHAENFEAKLDNSRHNTLIKAMGSVKL